MFVKILTVFDKILATLLTHNQVFQLTYLSEHQNLYVSIKNPEVERLQSVLCKFFHRFRRKETTCLLNLVKKGIRIMLKNFFVPPITYCILTYKLTTHPLLPPRRLKKKS